MKKLWLFLIILNPLIHTYATNYYIDPAGNDSNTGFSMSAAWQTLSKVNSTNFSSGDSVLFIRGGVWYGSITVNQNGSANAPVIWSAYGTGNDPLISGFIIASGWQNSGGGVYTFSSAALGSFVPQIVTLNGVVQPLGRFPKTNGKYMTSAGTTSITDPTLSNSPSFIGAQIIVRKNHWTYTKGTVTGQAGGVITFTGSPTYNGTPGYTYFFQNNINCLSQPGDWCYNAATKTVSMYFGSDSPSSYVVKISSQNALVNFAKSYTDVYNTFTGIGFEGGNYAFFGSGCSHLSIINCTINAIGDNAIDDNGSYLNITGNTITDVNNTAIVIRNNVSNCIVSQNAITRAGVVPGAGENEGGLYGGGSYCGIALSDPSSVNNTIQYNTLNNIGYNGIEANGDAYLVDKNFVNNACSVLDDGAGIYTDVGTSPITYKGRTISNNIVLNTLGVVPPGPYGPPDGLYETNEGHGIYLDDNSSNITVTGNSVANCGGNGFVLHNDYNITFSNNLSYNNAGAQLLLGYDNNTPALTGTNKNINITNNTLISNSKQANIIFLTTATGSSNSTFSTFGTADYNHYGSLYANQYEIQTGLDETAADNTLRTLVSWQTLTAQDQHSTFLSPVYTSVLFSYNASVLPKAVPLSTTFIDIQNKVYTSLILQPYTAIVLLNTGIPCNVTKPIIK